MSRSQEFVLTLSCRDAPGIVHAVSGRLFEAGCNILDSQQFGDVQSEDATGLFFMRVHFEAPPALAETAAVERLFAGVRERFGMELRLHSLARKPRLLLMVSRHGHCLNDLLFRVHSGQLDVEIAAIVSNHPDFATLAQSFGVAFHHLPLPAGADARGAPAQEQRIAALIEAERIDLVVLARYMQILSDEFCDIAAWPRHQHPPQLPAELQGRAAVPAGARTRRQVDRRHRPLRDRRSRRGSDHRAGRRARATTRRRRTTTPRSGATSKASCSRARCAGMSSTACC